MLDETRRCAAGDLKTFYSMQAGRRVVNSIIEGHVLGTGPRIVDHEFANVCVPLN
jgi:hypothetical protein